MSISRQIADLPEITAANTRHTMDGKLLKPARHLVLEEHPKGTYIFRYADDWSFGGDTWHTDAEEAREQIEFEYEVNELDWKPISEQEFITLTNPKS